MHTLKYRAYIKPLKRFAKGYETILYHHQCNMEPSWTVNITPEEYYGDEDLVIEEFTGLFDRNGKEIYEGDIVKCILGNKPIVFHDCRYWLGETLDDLFVANLRYDIEIIGNIHENSELLGGEE